MDARTYIEMKKRQREAAIKNSELRLYNAGKIYENNVFKQPLSTSDKYRGVINK